jgi:SAM-dependent methyltransferase
VVEKLVRTLDAVAGLAGADVLVLGLDGGRFLGPLHALGARPSLVAPAPGLDAAPVPLAGPSSSASEPDRPSPVEAPPGPPASMAVLAGTPAAIPLPDASVDLIIGAWSVYRGVDERELAEADRVLRATGRLVVVHDYGRDDLEGLRGPERPEVASWSRRGGPFLRAGFKIRVVHCRADFASLDEATEVLEEAFAGPGAALAGTLHRPRVTYNLAVYHRPRPAP